MPDIARRRPEHAAAKIRNNLVDTNSGFNLVRTFLILMSDKKIYMLNALWFKEDGGEEMYQQYLSKAMPFITAVGGRKLDSYVPNRAVIGEFDADLVFFIEYPSWEAFKTFMWNPDYQREVVPLRENAIRNSLLIRCARPTA